jgi:hypothetical protein
MSKNLVQRGNLSSPLLIWNRTVSKCEALKKRVPDCEIAPSVSSAVSRADIIFSCLADDNAVSKVFEEALSGDVKGKLFVSCSTITPKTTEEISSKCKELGAGFVSMPGKTTTNSPASVEGTLEKRCCTDDYGLVFGEPGLAEKGLLVCVPVGEPEDVKKVLPYTTGVYVPSLFRG